MALGKKENQAGSMRFPNAYAGVKKLYTSGILLIIALAFGLVTVFAAAFTAGIIETGVEEAMNAGFGVTGVLTIITAVLSLVCFVMNLVGLSQAGKDEPTFRYALYATILIIVVSVAENLAPEGFGKDVLSTVSEIALLLVLLLSIVGIISLAEKLKNAEMEDRGKKLLNLITVSIVVAGIARLVSHFTEVTHSFEIGGVVLGSVAVVIDLVASLMYLGYLNRAKRMLAR